MIDAFKAFLAGNPYKMDESQQKSWGNFAEIKLPQILNEWYDVDFGCIWDKDGDYCEKARLKLVVYSMFKEKCADAENALFGLKLIREFFADEKRKAGLGKTTKKAPKIDFSLNGVAPAQTKVDVLEEGAIKDMHIAKHERSPELRRACIEHYMAMHNGRIACEVCDMAFKDVYGEIGGDYIEVHHLSPISQIEGVHEVDPKTDLVPLCANCHAMIHRLMAAEKKVSGIEIEGVAALNKLKNIIKEYE